MLYDDYQGHDSLLEGIDIDTVKYTASIRLLSYETPGSPERIPITIDFSNVTSMTMQADMIQLANNRFAGTVAYWHIAEGTGTSYIYLIEGYVAVTADTPPKLVRH
jgi:hypothetical protein